MRLSTEDKGIPVIFLFCFVFISLQGGKGKKGLYTYYFLFYNSLQ